MKKVYSAELSVTELKRCNLHLLESYSLLMGEFWTYVKFLILTISCGNLCIYNIKRDVLTRGESVVAVYRYRDMFTEIP